MEKTKTVWSKHTLVGYILVDGWIFSILIWMFSTWGLGPLTGTFGAILALFAIGTLLVANDEDARRAKQRQLQQKQLIGQLEAESGIPLVEEGQCKKCKAKLVADARFCSKCGTPTKVEPKICQACGTRNQDFAQFCHECGVELVARPAQP